MSFSPSAKQTTACFHLKPLLSLSIRCLVKMQWFLPLIMDIELQALWFAAAVSFSLAGGDIEAAGQQEASMYC